MSKEAYLERTKRVEDAIALRVPDRVPVIVRFGFFPARYAGVSCEALMYDPERLREATWRTIHDFQPDMIENPYPVRYIGRVLDALSCRQLRWPGRTLPRHVSYQFVEAEYMKAEEYEVFLADPSDFMMRSYWPRIFGALGGLAQLPPVHDLYSYSGFSTALASPEFAETLDAPVKASQESRRVLAYTRRFAEQADREGYPMEAGCLVHVPFDVLGDYFRGTKGIMLDMYRRPDMVIKACERLMPFLIGKAVSAARASGNPRIFMPLHKGSDGFMSESQFLKFYWPTLREMMLAFIREGLVPCPFFEGEYASRLHIIRDIPPGKACYNFEATDLRKAKAVLGDRVCLRGGVPGSLLVAGTPGQVRAYCEALLRDVAGDGGFILDATTTLDDARPENVRAMFESVRE